MKIALNQATTMKRSSLRQDLELCESYGFDFIEIRRDKLREYLSEFSLDELQAFFRQNRLKPFALNALEFVTFRDRAGRQQLERELHELGQIGQTIGCRTIIAVPSFDVGEYSKTQIKQETVGVLQRLAELAETYGMRLALEFCGYPNCSVNTFAQAYEIVTAVNRENVGLVLDCFHFHAMNSRLEDLQQADPGKLFVFHLDDCEDLPAGALRDHHRVWPGTGAIDLDSILRTLRDIGYDEMTSLELFRPEYWEWEVEQVVRMGKETTERVIRRYFPNE
ncbi:sugar phosphate isomerase/epimerase family protein [Brevibacillus fulvus]|uniref:2-keto-myo-inositol isomerase n=1 Tax=Brevibacillus fulvus TaxID=1125967 RepID=A0A939BR41_9BACL|nr:sugar phosphate isomerase/epimerase [Brevibacillus fulvus]MBM7589187.1 2-keto-myo-inositol isomerase [Brevibacillus fulvus]